MVEKWLQRYSQSQGVLGLRSLLVGISSLGYSVGKGSSSICGGIGLNGFVNSQFILGGGDGGGSFLSFSWVSGNRGDGSLQRRVFQKELRKIFVRFKGIYVNRIYDEQVIFRVQESLSSVRRRVFFRKVSFLFFIIVYIFSVLLELRVNLFQYFFTVMDYKCYFKKYNERQFFLELVKDIFNDFDFISLSCKIFIFVCFMVDVDCCFFFLVEGVVVGKKSLVFKFFDVYVGILLLFCSSIENLNEVQVFWGKGIIGYVGEYGETVNIFDVYQVGFCIVFFLEFYWFGS